MCNAHNHPPGCTCGWGGEGHAGRSFGYGAYGSSTYYTPPYREGSKGYASFATYVNPTARCPVCGAAVFFYQSPEGGRVFFDELGPPWPKHPCTDSSRGPRSAWEHDSGTSSTSSTSYLGSSSNHAADFYTWFKQGWFPFIAEQTEVSVLWSMLEGYFPLSAAPLRVYVPTAELGSPDAPKLIRETLGDYTLTSLRIRPGGTVIAFQTRLYADIEVYRAWEFDPSLAALIVQFISREAWPRQPFTIGIPDGLGTRRWISNPEKLYGELRAMIAMEPERLSPALKFWLRQCLTDILRHFGHKP